jgi:hypothetical protein
MFGRENHMDHAKSVCGQSADVLNFKAGGTYSNRFNLKGSVRLHYIENKPVLKIFGSWNRF